MADLKYSYETVMIFNVQSGEEGIQALKERFRNLILANGVIDSEEDWGKRRLAYPIMDELEGYYFMLRFTSAGDFPTELERIYRITEGVLRSMIIRIEKPVPKEPGPEAAAEPEPEVLVDVVSESEPEATPEPEAVAEPEPEATPEPEAAPEPEPEIAAEPEAEETQEEETQEEETQEEDTDPVEAGGEAAEEADAEA